MAIVPTPTFHVLAGIVNIYCTVGVMTNGAVKTDNINTTDRLTPSNLILIHHIASNITITTNNASCMMYNNRISKLVAQLK